MINGLDIFILIGLAMAVAIGFFGGVARLLAMAAALYLGSVAAGRWYIDLAEISHRHINNFNVSSGQFVMFVAILIATTLALTPLLTRAFAKIRFPRRVQIADNVIGVMLGVAAAALAVVPMSLVLQALNQSVLKASGGSLLAGMHEQIDRSALIPVFLRMAPAFVQLISPWFPGGLPPMLSVVR